MVKILIVEDDDAMAENIETTLEAEGYSVAGRERSGKGALSLVAERKPDLVLMDIWIKGPIDGIETAKLIHDEYLYKHIGID